MVKNEEKKENIIIDKKLTCCSIMKTMKISEYLDMVEEAYKNKGGIQGQREPLKQKTAITQHTLIMKSLQHKSM